MATSKPVITNFETLAPLMVQKYQRYLPTAFSDDMTMLEKVNKIINFLGDTTDLFNDLVEQWNSVMEWVLNDGLNTAVQDKLDEMANDGTLEQIINENIFNDLNTKIDQLGVQLYASGNDDSSNFIAAANIAKSLGTHIFLADREYNITDAVTNTTIPSIIGKDSTINMSGDIGLKYDGDLLIKDVHFKSDYAPDININTDYFIKPTGIVDSIKLENVNYTSDPLYVDGSLRGKTFMEIKSKQIKIDGFYSKNNRQGFTIRNDHSINADNVSINNVHFENAETGIWIDHTDGLYTKNVFVTNCSLVNTQDQSNNFADKNGADLFIFGWVKNVMISKIYAERACERIVYINVAEDVKVDNVSLVFCEGVKVVGEVDKTTNTFNYTRNVTITNVTSRNGNNLQGVICYEVRGLTINGVNLHGEIGQGNNVGILLERSLEDVEVLNVTGKNNNRGVITFNIRAVPEYDTYFKNIKIDGIQFMNPCLKTDLYSVINLNGLVTPPTGHSPYYIENLHVSNVKVDNYIKHDETVPSPLGFFNADSALKGLIDIDRVTGLFIDNSRVTGIWDTNGGISVGPNSENVNIMNEVETQSGIYCPANLNVSANSKIVTNTHVPAKNVVFTNSIMALQKDGLMKLDNNHRGVFTGNVTLVDELTQRTPFDQSKSKIGCLKVYSDTGEYISVQVTATTITKIFGTANTATANTDNFLCVYFANGSLYIRNRLGVTALFIINLEYVNEV